ncbi:MAG: hypothetical protein DSY91_04180 [Deltaproteobacteria bacterium]|nr:MAG: hypothetical protein DSY91_04180 [Deltaproteobacteria bacterium]
MERDEEFIEIFTTPSPIEADYLRLFLEDNGISTFIRDLRITPYPVHVKNMAEQRLYVAKKDQEKAKGLILQAMEDQGITLEGNFTDEEDPPSDDKDS